MNAATSRPAGPVRVSITRIDLTERSFRQVGELLLDVEEGLTRLRRAVSRRGHRQGGYISTP